MSQQPESSSSSSTRPSLPDIPVPDELFVSLWMTLACAANACKYFVSTSVEAESEVVEKNKLAADVLEHYMTRSGELYAKIKARGPIK